MNLEFVTAEEAAKWPEGAVALVIYRQPTGQLVYRVAGDPQSPKWRRLGVLRYLRLPDTLPELQKGE